MLRGVVTDPNTGLSARVVDGISGPGLNVYSRDYHNYTAVLKPFINDDNGVDMNIDASAGGTPENVHDGTDNAYWTGANISGTIEFNSTTRFNSGASSIRFNSEAVGTTAQFAKGSDIDGSDYASVTMFINVNRRWEVGDSMGLYAWDTGTGSQIGSQVLLEDYISVSDNDVWQAVTIPLTDLGIESLTFDAFRIESLANNGSGPDFFIDDWQIQETGTPVQYEIQLNRDRIFYADVFRIQVANNVLASGLSWNQFFGESLAPGLNYRRTRQGRTGFSTNYGSISSLFWSGFKIADQVTDGTNTLFFCEAALPTQPLVFDPREGDSALITVSEDLSTFLQLRVAFFGREEPIV